MALSKVFKNRCYEQVRIGHNGLGCQWIHGYYRPECISRLDTVDRSRRYDLGMLEDREFFSARECLADNLFVSSRGGELKGLVFDVIAQREDRWYRKRDEGCVNPYDDEEWTND